MKHTECHVFHACVTRDQWKITTADRIRNDYKTSNLSVSALKSLRQKLTENVLHEKGQKCWHEFCMFTLEIIPFEQLATLSKIVQLVAEELTFTGVVPKDDSFYGLNAAKTKYTI